MFNLFANTTCNNTVFTSQTIVCMKKLHETVERLYVAAKTLKQVEGPANLARLLNESPQLINNWERRGMSASGILRAAPIVGCRVEWLKTGDGEMVDESSKKDSFRQSKIQPGQTDESHSETPAAVSVDLKTRARALAAAINEAADNGLVSVRLMSALEGMLEAGISQTSAVSFAKHSRAAIRAAVRSGDPSTNDKLKRRAIK
jgi:hypothetical protein